MKYLLVPLVVFGLGTAAVAAPQDPASASGSYPPCTSTKTDQCTQIGGHAAHHAARNMHHENRRHDGRHYHHRRHHAAKKSG